MDRITLCTKGPVVSFAIHIAKLGWVGPVIEVGVCVGGRVYQVRAKDGVEIGRL